MAGEQHQEVAVQANGVTLPGDLTVPSDALGVVVFAHGSGSSRFSTRNRMVAGRLNDRGFATLLFDLLTEGEAADRQNVFDIGLLADRMTQATKWLRGRKAIADLPVGYFGASTGAAAALVAAAQAGEFVRAIVSRGGRPDLARDALPVVAAPTLLIVGELDSPVIEMNKDAAARMSAPWELTIVSGATHLFEEPGALEEVARLAGEWFERHLPDAS